MFEAVSGLHQGVAGSKEESIIMLTNEKLIYIRAMAEKQQAVYLSNYEIRGFLEWIDFQAALISDLKTESSAFDVGFHEGEKKVLAALADYADGNIHAPDNVRARYVYSFIKSYLSDKVTQ